MLGIANSADFSVDGRYFLAVLSEYDRNVELGDPQFETRHTAGAVATWTVTSPVAVASGVQYLATPATDDVVMNGDTTVEVMWVTQYRVQVVDTVLSGSTNVTDDWFDAGDAVAITAANFVHARIAVAAAQAGMHVYCEKAMARNVAECWQMVRASQQNNVRLMVGHKRRLRPAWSRMIELTRPDAPLGEPVAITVTQYADLRPYEYPGTWWADPQRSGGAFAVYASTKAWIFAARDEGDKSGWVWGFDRCYFEESSEED